MLSFDSFLGIHYMDNKEANAAAKVIQSKSLFRYDGLDLQHKTLEFETNLSKFLNTKYTVACSSGTSALKMCCVALNIGPGDEVIMSPFTFIASAAAVLSCGALPQFVDVDKSMNIDPQKIEQYITERTKAIMAIHIQGIPCDMEQIVKIAKKHNLYIIEDCAQAFGAKYNNQRVGTIGDAAAFSLQANKVISCGEGGIFCCKSEEHFWRARNYHDNGAKRAGDEYPGWNDPTTSFGENFKITEIQSAIANEQLKKFDEIKEHQIHLYHRLMKSISNKAFEFREITARSEFTPVSICFIFDSHGEAQKFITFSKSHKIEADFYSDRVLTQINAFTHKQSWHSDGFPFNLAAHPISSCYYTKALISRTVWLPISPLLNDNDADYIAKTINSYS